MQRHPEQLGLISLEEDVNGGLVLVLILVGLLCLQPRLGLEDILAFLAIPHKDPQASIQQEHIPGI